MIFELIMAVFFGLADILLILLFGALGALTPLPDWGPYLVELLQYGLYFIPPDIFGVVVAYWLGWWSVHLVWGIIKFIIRLIPTLDA